MLKNYQTIIAVVIFVSISGAIKAQEKNTKEQDTTQTQIAQESKIKDNIFFGGSLGMQFGSLTMVYINPVIGYRVIPRLELGLGIRYEYYNDRRLSSNHFQTHIYGGNVFTRFRIIQDFHEAFNIGLRGGIFAHIEYEALSLESDHFDYSNQYANQDRFWLNSFLIGGGYHVKLSERAYAYIEILWNLTETENTPYQNPIYRIGFTF